MDLQLRQRLERVAARVRHLRFATRMALMWLVAAAIGLAILLIAKQQGWVLGPTWSRGIAISSLVIALLLWVLTRLRRPNLVDTAQQIEQSYPSLNERLLAAISQKPQTEQGFGYLQKQLIQSTVDHDREHGWHGIIPSSRLAWAWLFNLPGIVALLAVLAAISTMHEAAKHEQQAASVQKAKDDLVPRIVPGNTEVEMGQSVIVTAEFNGKVPERVVLHRESNSTATTGESKSEAIQMRRSLDDPIFAGYLFEVREPVKYWVEYDEKQTETYEIKVFQYPAVVRVDASLEYPAYTRMETKNIVDTRRVSAVVGTKLTWQCNINKPVTKGWLKDEQGAEIPLAIDASQPTLLKTTIELAESRTWTVHLEDDAGRLNKVEIKLSAKVLPNNPPQLKLATGDVRVSPIEELLIQAKVATISVSSDSAWPTR